MNQRHVDTLERPGLFDRFAVWSASLVSRAPFFAFCVLVVVAWAPTYPLVGNIDTWQLLINTPTTILTFPLVAVLQNSQRRGEQALHTKLDAVADGLADLMEHFSPSEGDKDADLAQDIVDLKRIVGSGVTCRPSIRYEHVPNGWPPRFLSTVACSRGARWR